MKRNRCCVPRLWKRKQILKYKERYNWLSEAGRRYRSQSKWKIKREWAIMALSDWDMLMERIIKTWVEVSYFFFQCCWGLCWTFGSTLHARGSWWCEWCCYRWQSNQKTVLQVESWHYTLSPSQTSRLSVVGEVVFRIFVNQCETGLQMSFSIQKQWGAFTLDSCGNPPNQQQHVV